MKYLICQYSPQGWLRLKTASVTMETIHTAQQLKQPGDKINLVSVNLQINFFIKQLFHKKS